MFDTSYYSGFSREPLKGDGTVLRDHEDTPHGWNIEPSDILEPIGGNYGLNGNYNMFPGGHPGVDGMPPDASASSVPFDLDLPLPGYEASPDDDSAIEPNYPPQPTYPDFSPKPGQTTEV